MSSNLTPATTFRRNRNGRRSQEQQKSPSQNPVDFFKCQQQGGTHGTPQKVGDKLTGGPMRESVYGRKDLSKQ